MAVGGAWQGHDRGRGVAGGRGSGSGKGLEWKRGGGGWCGGVRYDGLGNGTKCSGNILIIWTNANTAAIGRKVNKFNM